MLKIHLTIRYLLNSNFTQLDHFTISKIIQYCRGFLQLDKIEWNNLKQAVNKAQASLLIPLPNDPSLISNETKKLLPFELPIANRNNMKGTVMALRKIFSFTQLPETYFIKLPTLPNNPSNLDQELKKFFPITK